MIFLKQDLEVNLSALSSQRRRARGVGTSVSYLKQQPHVELGDSGAFTGSDLNWTEECGGLLVASTACLPHLPTQFSEDQSLRTAWTLQG